MRRVRLVRAWACYWLLAATGVFPRSWQFAWPLWFLQVRLMKYGGWWALRQNPNLPDELRKEMR